MADSDDWWAQVMAQHKADIERVLPDFRQMAADFRARGMINEAKWTERTIEMLEWELEYEEQDPFAIVYSLN